MLSKLRESAPWLIWLAPLVITIFFWSVNEYMRGRRSELISGFLAIVIFALIVVAFFHSGWLVGLIALTGSFVGARIILLVVGSLFFNRNEYIGGRAEDILSSYTSPLDLLKRMEAQRQQIEIQMIPAVEYAMSLSSIQTVLAIHSADREIWNLCTSALNSLGCRPKSRR